MNLENITFHLIEARGALDDILKSIKEDEEYFEGDLSQAMSHLYYHLNTAWNSRNASPKDVRECSDENFNLWKKFPQDSELEFGE